MTSGTDTVGLKAAEGMLQVPDLCIYVSHEHVSLRGLQVLNCSNLQKRQINHGDSVMYGAQNEEGAQNKDMSL